MLERHITLQNKLGLHARAAAKLVNTAAGFASRVSLEFKGQTADAKSIMSVMILAAASGSEILIRCEGEDEAAAMDAICALIENLFGEDE